jgi:hypothetical protein
LQLDLGKSKHSYCSRQKGDQFTVLVVLESTAVMLNRVLMVQMVVVFWLFVCCQLSNAYTPANLGQETYAVGEIFKLDTTSSALEKKRATTRVVGKIKKDGPFLHRLQAAKPVKSQDLTNTNKGPILLAPKVFNIFRGNTWTPVGRNLVDNFATNVAKTDYWKILRTQKSTTGASCADLEFKGSALDTTAVGLIDIDPNENSGGKPWVTSVFQSYVTAKKVQTAGDFDLKNFDLANTILAGMSLTVRAGLERVCRGWEGSPSPG